MKLPRLPASAVVFVWLNTLTLGTVRAEDVATLLTFDDLSATSPDAGY
jgi:hypothetical protein